MMKKMSIRLRLTILSIFLLIFCCIGLTVILNYSANRMADVIEAVPVTPAVEFGAKITPSMQVTTAIDMETLMPSETSQAARNRFLYQSFAYAGMIIVLGGVLTYYVSGKALRPLQELSAQMKNRTVHNLSQELPLPQSKDEIADLTRSFNEMSGKLDEAFAMQKRFAQSAAHELRTPLAVIKTKVDVFEKKQIHTPEEYHKLVTVITTYINRLSDLVKDLLNLSNMDALDCDEQIELKKMLFDVVHELSSLAAEKKLAITMEGIEKEIVGNKSLLHRAFYNLIENAIKYNVEGGTVRISVMTNENQVTIAVSDSGIGIPSELGEQIFEPFFRVDKSRSRQMGGAGLGLPMVKAVVDKHHGILKWSENPGGGSVFTITL